LINDYRVWAKIPRILSTGAIYKDFDIAFGSFGTQYKPVANGGPGYAGFVDSVTELITVSFDASNSLNVQGTGSLTYLWDIGDGTLTSGLATDAGITATFPAGFRWVHLTATHSVTGQSHTCHIPVFAAETSGANKPFEHFVGEQILRAEGQTFRATILEDIPADEYPDGTLVMYWEEEYYDAAGVGSLSGPAGREHMKFIGWVQRAPAEVQREKTGLLRDTVLECVDVAGRLRSLPGFPQLLERAAAPGRWGQMDDPDIDRYIHYLLHWHSTALDLADFQWSGLGASTYYFLRLGSDGQSLYDQVDQRAKAIGHRLTCDMWGRLDVVRDEMLADSRHSTNIVSLTEADYASVRFERQRPPRVHWLRGYAVLASETAITAVRCIAPGEAPGQGESSQEQNYQLVTDQDALNAREGHRYARLNAPEGLWDFELAHGGDAGINPAWFEWVPVTLGAAYAAQQGLTLTAARFLPQEVVISHERERGGRTKSVRLRMEREVTGVPAQTVIIPPSPNLRTPRVPRQIYPRTVWRRLGGSHLFYLKKGLVNMVAINYDGYLYRTSDFETPAAARGPTWARFNLNAATIGNILDFCVDPWSPKYLNTGTQVNGWIATTKGIYRVTDLLGATPVATLQFSFAATLGAAQTAYLEFGWGQQNWGVCVIHYQSQAGHTGTWVTYTTDGTNWASESQITAHYVTGGAFTFQPGLFASSRIAGRAYTSALTATGGGGSATSYYLTTDHGATWSEVTSPTNFTPIDAFVGDIRAPWDDNADQAIVYAGGQSIDGTGWIGRQGGLTLRKNADGSISNVTPTYNPGAGVRYFHPGTRWGLQICPDNRQRVILNGWDDPNAYYTGQTFVSQDGGDSWTHLSALSGFLGRVFLADGGDVIYAWGSNGSGAARFYYSTNFGATIESKLGNIPVSFPAAADFVGIAGG
jgi:hypothetical protein